MRSIALPITFGNVIALFCNLIGNVNVFEIVFENKVKNKLASFFYYESYIGLVVK
jgi:hypothetical protein